MQPGKDGQQYSDTQIVRTVDLNSGEKEFAAAVKHVVDIAGDGKGNVYILRRTDRIASDDQQSYHWDGYVEKYSVVPWQNLWSRQVEAPAERHHPLCLRYKDGLVWYSFIHGSGGRRAHEEMKWRALDAETGEPAQPDRSFDPYKTETTLNGKRYTLKWVGHRLQVTSTSEAN
jgi:hypothetical protein